MNDTTTFFPSNSLVHHDNDTNTLSRGSIKSMEQQQHQQQRTEKHFLMEEMKVRYNDEISLTGGGGRDITSSSKKSKSNNFETESQKRAAAKSFAKSYLAAKYAADKTLSRTKSLSTSDDDDMMDDHDDDVNAAATATSTTVLLTDSGDFEEDIEDPSSEEFSPTNKTRSLPRSSARFDQPSAVDVDDDDDDKFSVSEMKQLVMDSLPPEIRDQVPSHAWDRIFRRDDDDSMVSDQSPLVRRLKHGSREDVSDLVSVISSIVSRRVSMASVQSDVSGITEAFSTVTPAPKQVKKDTQPMNKKKNTNPAAVVSEKARSSVPTMISLSSSEMSDAGKEGKTPRVAFGEVQVRNYPTILTINPAVTSGPAIGLGWTYDAKKDETYTLDEYETAREGHRQDDILLSRNDRENLLLELGYSQKDLADSIRKTIRVKNQRKQTVQNLNVSPVEEFLEKTTRRVKRILKFKLIRSSSKTDLVIPKAVSPPSSVSTAS